MEDFVNDFAANPEQVGWAAFAEEIEKRVTAMADMNKRAKLWIAKSNIHINSKDRLSDAFK